MDFVIYGAQAIALGTYKAIKELLPDYEIKCFLVTEKGDNAPVLGGIPVYELRTFSERMSVEEKQNTEILIATPETVMEEIERGLQKEGFDNFVRMDSVRWSQLQQMAFAKSGRFLPISVYPLGVHLPQIQVYMAKFYRDKPLSGTFTCPEYITDLQVGASRTEIRVAELLDNTGDHISERNANYSELTGLYWMWKNRILKDDNRRINYYGLAHYRRVLDMTDDDLRRMQDHDIDVVLPYPMPYEPNIEVHHERYLSSEEWGAVLMAVQELQPMYSKTLREVLQQEYLYNYNLIIAKGHVLDAYCEWLFPILFRVEELVDPVGQKKPNRYIGYIGETLETLYFMHHKNDLRIVHTGCRFLL